MNWLARANAARRAKRHAFTGNTSDGSPDPAAVGAAAGWIIAMGAASNFRFCASRSGGTDCALNRCCRPSGMRSPALNDVSARAVMFVEIGKGALRTWHRAPFDVWRSGNSTPEEVAGLDGGAGEPALWSTGRPRGLPTRPAVVCAHSHQCGSPNPVAVGAKAGWIIAMGAASNVRFCALGVRAPMAARVLHNLVQCRRRLSCGKARPALYSTPLSCREPSAAVLGACVDLKHSISEV